MLVGLDTPDDGGVYRLGPDVALIQTLDFFTPILDDPFEFGRVAAANALSDVYAMGGRPVTALNLVGFPAGKVPLEMLAEILRGGAETVARAGAAIVGGHSIDDVEPKYGLAVTGIVHPDRILTKGGIQPGDVLLLTKPLGIGVLMTAAKKDKVRPDVMTKAVATMVKLNDQVDGLHALGVRAVTDVTGFGLLGHLHEMARASGLAVRVNARQVPFLPQTRELAEAGFFCGGSKKNRLWLEGSGAVAWPDRFDDVQRGMLCDTMTSGGLLVAAPAAAAEAVAAHLLAAGALLAAPIGQAFAGPAGRIEVQP